MRLLALILASLNFLCTSIIVRSDIQASTDFLTGYAWLIENDGYIFEAVQSSKCSKISINQPDPQNSITRQLKGMVAKDGRFKYEIMNIGGPDIGINWVIAYDGKLTYILESSNGVNNAYIKRGQTVEDPFLARVDPILLPYMFLKEKSLLPGDMGTYVDIRDVIAAGNFNDWMNNSIRVEEDELTTTAHRKINLSGDKNYNLSVAFDKKISVPQVIKISSEASDEIQTQNVSWKRGAYGFPLPVKVNSILYSEYQDTKCELDSKIIAFRPVKSFDENMFKIDLSNVDHIVDRDEHIIIPVRKKQ